MPTPEDPQQALQDAITELQSRRILLGDALVDAALAPLLERLAALSAQPEPTDPTAPAEPARRLRQVSVLFLDIVGSTQLIQLLDPEEVQATVDGALAAFSAIVENHGGEVLRYAGDNLKVAFGAHDTAGTREDDAERAVHCGLALLAEAARRGDEVKRLHGFEGFNARVGIHTGGVVRGGGVENENSLSGLPVNIAARLEQAAPAGRLRISTDTWALVRGAFDAEAQPPLQVKGVDAPLKSYLVRAARDRSVATIERGLQGVSTPMVGRQVELQRLQHGAALTRQTKRLHAVTLLGDAGLGKSRLLREFKATLLIDPSSSQLLTVRAQPDSQLRPWGLLRSMLAVQCGVADTDSAEVARSKVVEDLIPWFDERGERQAQLIGQLSGLDFADSPNVKGLDPRTLRDQALAAFRSYLQALATRGDAVLVLLVEDLHWCDDSSLDLLQHLLAHATDLPLLLVMTARPALLARRPDWGAADTALNTLVTLTPLAASQGDELVRALLQRMAKVPPRLMALITGQAEGNPYYMEELVRRLIDDGVITTVITNDSAHWQVQIDRLDTLRLPTTLVGLLQARLDALPAAERKAARQASVIGHVFWDDALEALDASAPQALPALQRAAYVREHETSDFEGTPERQFDHHLLHQVTYDTLLKAERRLGHGAAARWLAERTQGRGAEFLAMTGEHAERAGEVALAIDCFEKAGSEAQKRFANAIAQSYFRRALDLLCDAQPARAIDLWDRLEKIADTIGDRAAQDVAHQQIATMLERHPDDHRQARLTFSMALLADRRGDAAASEPLARQTFELAERCGAAQWAAMAQGQLAWLRMARQDYPGARPHIASGLLWAGRIVSETVRAETEAQLLTLSGMGSMQICRPDEARATLTAVLSRGEALGRPRLQLGALKNLSIVAACLGRWDEVAGLGQRMCALAHAIGSRSDVAGGQLQLARAAESLGDTAAALGWHLQNLVIERAIGNRRFEAITLRFLSGLHLQQGDAQTALQCCAESQTLREALDEPREACEVAATAALCAIHLGQSAVALAGLNATLDQLQRDLTACPANETIELRWRCQQVMAALDDARAGPLLEQLFADVQAHATLITDAADRDRLIQALPVWRAIVAAHAQRGALTRPRLE
jgi:class 3 adenylate cyclase/tetratricopeptide (TPR) repeat protein